MRVPLGFTMEVRKVESSMGDVHNWRLKMYSKMIKEGVEGTKKEAEKAMWDAFRAHMEQGQGGAAGKQNARAKLNYLVKSRPYLVAGLCEAMLAKGDVAQAMKDIEVYEEAWREKDPPQYRQKASTHHRALSTGEATERVVDVMETLGFIYREGKVRFPVNSKVFRFAQKMFGDHFTNPNEVEEGEIEE